MDDHHQAINKMRQSFEDGITSIQEEFMRKQQDLNIAKKQIELLSNHLSNTEKNHSHEHDEWEQENRLLKNQITIYRTKELEVKTRWPKNKEELCRKVSSIRNKAHDREGYWKEKIAEYERIFEQLTKENARMREIMNSLGRNDFPINKDPENLLIAGEKITNDVAPHEAQAPKRILDGQEKSQILGPPPPPPNFGLARHNSFLDISTMSSKTTSGKKRFILNDDVDADHTRLVKKKDIRSPHKASSPVAEPVQNSVPNKVKQSVAEPRGLRFSIQPLPNEFLSPHPADLNRTTVDESPVEPPIPPRFSMASSTARPSVNASTNKLIPRKPNHAIDSTVRKPSNLANPARFTEAVAESPDAISETPIPPTRSKRQISVITIHSTPPDGTAEIKSKGIIQPLQRFIPPKASSKNGNDSLPGGTIGKVLPKTNEMVWDKDIEDALNPLKPAKVVEVVDLDYVDEREALETSSDMDGEDLLDEKHDQNNCIHQNEFSFDSKVDRVYDTFFDEGLVPAQTVANPDNRQTLDRVENTLVEDMPVLIQANQPRRQTPPGRLLAGDVDRIDIDNNRSKKNPKQLPVLSSPVKTSAITNKNLKPSKKLDNVKQKNKKFVMDNAGRPLRGDQYAFEEVVRKKNTRGQLHAVDCECCKDYYDITKDIPRVDADGRPVDAIAQNSRHRSIFPANPPTPPFLFDADFPTSQEVAQQNKFSERQVEEWRRHLQDLEERKQNPLK